MHREFPRVAIWVVLLAAFRAATAGAAGPSQADLEKVSAALPSAPAVRPMKPRRVLIFTLCRGFRHGSIPVGAAAVEMIGTKTGAYSSETTDDVQTFTREKLSGFDAVCMMNTTGELFAGAENEGELKQSFTEFVEAGGGLIGIHAATDCFYKWPQYGEMMGGYFDGHPWHTKVPVKNDDPAHPLNAAFGGAGFTITDEIYQFKNPYSRRQLRVLLSLDGSKMDLARGKRADGDYAVSWIRRYGMGRVFYCSLGHRNEIFWNPDVLKHYLAGIQFALDDLQTDVRPSAAVGMGGWMGLLNGEDLSGFMNRSGGPPGAGWVLEEGALVRKGGAGDIWTKERFGDFVLQLEFLTEGNSGIFIRTDKPQDNVQTGIEIQVHVPRGDGVPTKHSCGAVYDCLAASEDVVNRGEWNEVTISAVKNKITVVMNDRKVVDMDLDQWTQPNMNPDGTKNKFRTALKDFKREGHIGFQDHGSLVRYRNIRVRTMDLAEEAFAAKLRGAGSDAAAAELCRKLMGEKPDDLYLQCMGLSQLVKLSGKSAMGEVLSALDHANSMVRRAAARLASEMPGEDVTKRIVAEAKTAPARRRLELLRVLVRRADPVALPAVRERLNDEDPDIRAIAAEAVGAAGDAETLPELIDLLLGADTSGLRAALERAVLLNCRRLGDPQGSVAALSPVMRRGSIAARCSALNVLGGLGDEPCIAAVVAALDDRDYGVRSHAVDVLAASPSATAGRELHKLARESDEPDIRGQAFRKWLSRALREQKPGAGRLAMLERAMRMAQRREDKQAVIAELANIRTVASLELLKECFEDPDALEAAAAAAVAVAQALGGAGNDQKAAAVAAMEAVVRKSPNPATRAAADKFVTLHKKADLSDEMQLELEF